MTANQMEHKMDNEIDRGVQCAIGFWARQAYHDTSVLSF